MFADSLLSEFNASDVRMNFFGGGNEKMRAFFTISDKEKAIQCFRQFAHGNSSFFPGARLIVFLIKKEEIFVKYGDIMAAKYEEELKK